MSRFLTFTWILFETLNCLLKNGRKERYIHSIENSSLYLIFLLLRDCCSTFTFWFYISIGKNQNANLRLSFFSWCCLALRKANSTAQKSSWVLSFTLLLMIGQMIHTTPATKTVIPSTKIITHFVLDDWAQKF